MKLLLDLGNSRVKWAWLEAGELQQPGSSPHRPDDAFIDALVASGMSPDEIVLATVASPGVTAKVSARLADRWPVPLRRAVTEVAANGVRNGYSKPLQMGVDRWLAMVGAFARFRTSVCVVDVGTALTIDLVGEDGLHHGGLILPGYQLMRGALLRDTGAIGAAVRLVPAAGERGLLGRDTESCIRNAALRASACLVESCVKTSTHPGQAEPILVLTGGDAPILLEGLSIPGVHRPWLVLEGLALRCSASGALQGPP